MLRDAGFCCDNGGRPSSCAISNDVAARQQIKRISINIAKWRIFGRGALDYTIANESNLKPPRHSFDMHKTVARTYECLHNCIDARRFPVLTVPKAG